MKIILDLNPILNNKTGVGWYTYNLIKSMSILSIQYGLPIQFNGLAMDIASRRMKNYDINELKKILPIEVSPFITYGLLERIWNIRLVNYQTFFKITGDIYHFFNFTLPPNIKQKKIITIYDMVYYKYPETMKKSNYYRLRKEISRSIQEADTIITISETIKKEICDIHGVRSDKIKIVYPGIFNDNYNYNYSQDQISYVKKKYTLPDNYILYLGTLEPRKNIVTLIEGFALLKKRGNKQIKLVIAGAKGWNYEIIYSRVNELSLTQDIQFIGYVDEHDKPLLYKLSIGFVFPSIYEGFGMPLLEAMAAGVPVIISKAPALQEVAQEAAIYLENNDSETLSLKIEQIITDNSLRESMIKLGKKRSMQFSWENSAREMLGIYQSMEFKD